jgi:hypothetical protein
MCDVSLLLFASFLTSERYGVAVLDSKKTSALPKRERQRDRETDVINPLILCHDMVQALTNAHVIRLCCWHLSTPT